MRVLLPLLPSCSLPSGLARPGSEARLALIEVDWLVDEVVGLSEGELGRSRLARRFPDSDRDGGARLIGRPGETLAHHLERLAAVRAALVDQIRTLSVEEFAEPRARERWDVSPAWVLHHLLQHEAEHRIEIAGLRVSLPSGGRGGFVARATVCRVEGRGRRRAATLRRRTGPVRVLPVPPEVLMAATTSEPGVRTPRVATTVPVALGVFVVYVVVFIGAMKASGIDYDDVIDTAGNTWRAVVLPLAGGSVWLALFAWWSRWDNVFRDPRRLPMGVWLWAAPGFMVAVLLLRFGGVAWGDFTAGHLAAIAVGSVLVGFAEETLFRGVILRALRNGARHEGQVVLWTSLWFGFFHATNLITGQSIAATVQQIFAASLFGVALFLARRARGLLLWGMVLHGVWDMSSFFSGARDSDSPLLVISGLLSYVLMLFAVVALVVVWRRHDVVADA